jgi:hypothetical protein
MSQQNFQFHEMVYRKRDCNLKVVKVVRKCNGIGTNDEVTDGEIISPCAH